jgi:single-strand DNA-binding protein
MDLNKVMLIGRLTRDPESRTIPSGQTVTTFSVATSRTWKDRDSGQQKSQTEFHNVVAWRRLAEIVSQYLRKGSQVYLEGHLQTRSWDDQSGTKRYRTEVIADNLIMLGGKGQSGGGMAAAAGTAGLAGGAAAGASFAADDTPPAPQPADDEETISVEDIPF